MTIQACLKESIKTQGHNPALAGCSLFFSMAPAGIAGGAKSSFAKAAEDKATTAIPNPRAAFSFRWPPGDRRRTGRTIAPSYYCIIADFHNFPSGFYLFFLF